MSGVLVILFLFVIVCLNLGMDLKVSKLIGLGD